MEMGVKPEFTVSKVPTSEEESYKIPFKTKVIRRNMINPKDKFP
jgi:hypothetical protein